MQNTENRLAQEDYQNYKEHLDYLIEKKVLGINNYELVEISQYFINGEYVAAHLRLHVAKTLYLVCIQADDNWTTTVHHSFARLYDVLSTKRSKLRFITYTYSGKYWSANTTGTLQLSC